MRKDGKDYVIFLLVLSGLFSVVVEVRGDIPVPRPGGGSITVNSWTLLIISIIVLVLGVSSYLLLRRIRKNK
jgi:heme/copper-type cytochrome/quinol oxidase subunit 2